MNHVPKNRGTIYILIGVIIFLILTSYLWNFTVDDAYISFRFASHLTQGQGLVWNLNSMPVEGYTNFLWVLLSTIAFILKIDPVIFTRIINSISLIGIMIIFWKLSKDVFDDDKSLAYLSFSFGVLILLSNPATVVHFLSGLETFTYSFFVLAITFFAFKIIKSKNSKAIWIFSILGFLTGLLRPEGFLITAGLFFLILIFFKKYHHDQVINIIKSFSLFFMFPIALYMSFRLNYFNEIFPLPFLVKTMNYGGFNNFTENFSLYYVIPILFVIVPSIYYATRKKANSFDTFSTETKYVLFLIIILIVAVCANFIYINMSLIMNYAQRFFYPTLVLLYILSAISIVLIKDNINCVRSIRFSKSIEIVLVILLIFSNIYFLPEIAYTKNYATDLNEAHIPLGKALEQYSDHNYTAVCIDVGAIPYYSKWKFIDLEGLTDVFIAKNHEISYDYLSKNDPELIILVSGDGVDVDLYAAHNQKIPYKYVIQNNYTALSPIKFNKRYYFIPFLKPGIDGYDKISNTINEVAKSSKNEKDEFK